MQTPFMLVMWYLVAYASNCIIEVRLCTWNHLYIFAAYRRSDCIIFLSTFVFSHFGRYFVFSTFWFHTNSYFYILKFNEYASSLRFHNRPDAEYGICDSSNLAQRHISAIWTASLSHVASSGWPSRFWSIMGCAEHKGAGIRNWDQGHTFIFFGISIGCCSWKYPGTKISISL